MGGIFASNVDINDLIIKAMKLMKHRGRRVYKYSSNSFHGGVIANNIHEGIIFNEDQTLVLLIDGVILNSYELRRKLRKPHDFSSNSLNEVLVHLYEELGIEFVKFIDGAVSLILYDEKDKKLLIYRDLFCRKPLYIYINEDKDIFISSEIKAIIMILEDKFKLNKLVLPYQFAFGFCPSPHTLIKSIYKCKAGILYEYNLVNNSLKEIYNQLEWLSNIDKDISVRNIYNLVYNSIANSVKKIVNISETEDIGVMSSGGVDSAFVIGVLRDINVERIKTYTCGFEVDEDYERYNVSIKYARIVSDYFSTEHKEFFMTYEDFINLLEPYVYYLDEVVDNHPAPFYLAKKIKKDGITYVITGDAAAIPFGINLKYIIAFLSLSLVPYWMRRIISNLFNGSNKVFILNPYLTRNIPLHIYYKEIKNLFNYSIDNYIFKFIKKRYQSIPCKNRILRYILHDISMHYTENLRHHTEKACISNSIEIQTPYLSREVIELGFSLPLNYKLNKVALKKTFYRYYNVQTVSSSWVMPFSKWLRIPDVRDFVLDNIISNIDIIRFIFDSGINSKDIENMISRHVRRERYLSPIIFHLLLLSKWIDIYAPYIKIS